MSDSLPLLDFSTISFGTYLTVILGLGIIAQWLAWRGKVPSILLLLVFGFGANVLFGISIANHLDATQTENLLLPIIGLSVAMILFEGGLTLKLSDLRESGAPVLRLCSVGVLVSFVLTSAIGIYFFQWNWRVATILGSILVVTGPTVIGPLLQHVKPTKKVAAILRWEGIVVDPIGAILAVLAFQTAISGDWDTAKTTLFHTIATTLVVGGLSAFLITKIIEYLFKHHLIPDFLHSVFIISAVAVAYTVSNHFTPESGLLTVTVMGITLANQKSVSVKRILEFKENLRLLIISILFLVLSGNIVTSDLARAARDGVILLLLLIVVVRPASIFIANLFSRQTTAKERVFLAAMAPRGVVAAAVTSIFALEMQHAAHRPGMAEIITPEITAQMQNAVPVMFIIIIGTVAFYGLLASPLANRLGLATKNPTGILFAGAGQWTRAIAKALYDDVHEVLLLDTNFANVSAAKMEGLPAKHANILSDYVEEEIDFSRIGQLVAATPNDEVNSLAAREYNHIFGSANIWQVAPTHDDAHRTKSVSSHMRGRILFPDRPKYSTLRNLVQEGYKVKKTTISDQFTYADFLANNEGAIVLFTYSKDKGLQPATGSLKTVAAGTAIYSFVKESETPSKEESAGGL